MNFSQPRKSSIITRTFLRNLLISHHRVGHPLQGDSFQEIPEFLTTKQVTHYNETIFKKYLNFSQPGIAMRPFFKIS